MSYRGTASSRFEELRQRYTNCTYVDGNVEINALDEEDNYDLSFLENIREITGYLLINMVHADVIPLTSLRIIRGRELFSYSGQDHSIYIARNYKHGKIGVGLESLPMTSLHGE